MGQMEMKKLNWKWKQKTSNSCLSKYIEKNIAHALQKVDVYLLFACVQNRSSCSLYFVTILGRTEDS